MRIQSPRVFQINSTTGILENILYFWFLWSPMHVIDAITIYTPEIKCTVLNMVPSSLSVYSLLKLHNNYMGYLWLRPEKPDVKRIC